MYLEYEIGGHFLDSYFENALGIGDGAPVGPLDPYVGGRQGFSRLRIKDLSAYDAYGLLGIRSPDTGHSRQHGNKNQFAEHGVGKGIWIDTKYRYEATNRKTVGVLCFAGIEARSMPRGKSRPKDREITDDRVP